MSSKCSDEQINGTLVYLKISSAIEEVTHIIVAHADAFLDEIGFVVVQLAL